jgi:hypothetical protein
MVLGMLSSPFKVLEAQLGGNSISTTVLLLLGTVSLLCNESRPWSHSLMLL